MKIVCMVKDDFSAKLKVKNRHGNASVNELLVLVHEVGKKLLAAGYELRVSSKFIVQK